VSARTARDGRKPDPGHAGAVPTGVDLAGREFYGPAMTFTESSRLRLGIDIVGLHSMDDAVGLQMEMRRAALAWVSEDVRVDVVDSHLHETGCEFCSSAVSDPDFGTHRVR
jgi:hypothetical protein